MDIHGHKAQYRPGEAVTLVVHLPEGPVPDGCRVEVDIWELQSLKAQLAAAVEPGQDWVELAWSAPDCTYAAFGLAARVMQPDGTVAAQATGALDVTDAWWRTPRMGFLTDFSPGETLTETRRRLQALARLHLTCLHFYDWMYSHYQYLPPEDTFVDPMGRHLSILAVRRKVRMARELGMAPLAYGPLYGAEEAFVREHPDWALYRGDGVAFSVARLFYIMDFRIGSGWTDHLLEQYRQAVTEMGFAGIMIDQYGYPKRALPYPGTFGAASIDLSDHFGPLIDAADAAVRAIDPEARVLFHVLNNWPMRKVANARQVVHYVEAYRPHVTYRDLRDLIAGARALAPAKPVVLGAFLEPLADPGTGAGPALLLLTAVIHACGGYQLLLGEGEGAITSGYFPDYARIPAEILPAMRAYHDFVVRYGPLLHAAPEQDVSETHAGGVTEDYSFAGAPTSASGLPGHIWTIVREHPGLVSIQLINLLGSEGRWNRPQPAPPTLENLEVSCRIVEPVQAVYVASPDWTGGQLHRLEHAVEVDSQIGHVVRFRLPRLEIWDMVLLITGQGGAI